MIIRASPFRLVVPTIWLAHEHLATLLPAQIDEPLSKAVLIHEAYIHLEQQPHMTAGLHSAVPDDSHTEKPAAWPP